MKKMLYISDVIPDPRGTGSEQRAYSILRSYARHFDIELWCHPRGDRPEAKRIISSLEFVSELIFFYPSIIAPKSLLAARLNAALESADLVHMFKFPIQFNHPNTIWDIDELPDDLRLSDSLFINDTPYDKISDSSLNYVEFSKATKFVIVSSTVERSALIKNIRHVTNSYPAPIDTPLRRKGNALLYVGHLGYWPNIDAIRYFLEEIFPRLPQKTIFRIVGRRPHLASDIAFLKTISAIPRVEIHLDVETCTPHYEDAIAAIVPLRHGRGTRLKILEAFTHSCPVISTTKGVEGLGVETNKDFLLADTPEEFELAVFSLLTDENLGEQLTRSALEFYNKNNSQGIVDKQVDVIIEDLKKATV